MKQGVRYVVPPVGASTSSGNGATMPTDGGQRRRGADGLEDAGRASDDVDGRRVGFAGGDTGAYKVRQDGGFGGTCTAGHVADSI
jgi:hypothetical protein